MKSLPRLALTLPILSWLLLCCGVLPAYSATYTVTNTNDSGAGSLRSALLSANNNSNGPGADLINFNIPGTGILTISPLTPLPLIVEAVTINGFSQPGSAANTSASADNAAIRIFIKGSAIPTATGLSINAANCTLKGLKVGSFATGILISGSIATKNRVEGCYVGSSSPTSPSPNGDGIAILDGATLTTIGGALPATRNVISGNNGRGVYIAPNGGSAPQNNVIAGNLIGTDSSTFKKMGNGSYGVFVSGAANTMIGGTVAGAGNIISGNADDGVGISGSQAAGNQIQGNWIGTNTSGTNVGNGDQGISLLGCSNNAVGNRAANVIVFNAASGVALYSTSTGNAIRGNSIHSNGALGIKLLSGSMSPQNAPVPNDIKDIDGGPNKLQNFPIINSLSDATGRVVLNGVLDSTPNTTFSLDIFASNTADASGYGEGQFYLGTVNNIRTDASGHTTWVYRVLPEATTTAQRYSATATSSGNDTSEFSPAVALVEINYFLPRFAAPGTSVTLTGLNFTGATSVQFAGTAATFSVNGSGTSISTTVPAGARTGPIRVVTPQGTAETQDNFIVTPPFNDNFANAALLTPAGGSVIGSNIGATKETSEPTHAAPGGVSVWYKWKPTFSGRASIGICNNTLDTLLAVYTGTALNNLQPVASNNNLGNGTNSAVTFSAIANLTYYIAVDGASGSQGSFTLQWNIANAGPANNNFGAAQVIYGDEGSTTGTNLLATKESGEPSHATKTGGTSVWYLWTAPSSGRASFSTDGSTFDTLLAVYTGTGLTTLTSVASSDDSNGSSTSRVDFNAAAGITYRIAVDGFEGAQGNIALGWRNIVSDNSNVIKWVGTAGDGLWGNPVNWDLNRTPAPNDKVIIAATGVYTVQLNLDSEVESLVLGSSNSAVQPSLLIDNSHTIAMGSADIQRYSSLDLVDGTVTATSDMQVSGTVDWSGGTLNGAARTNITATGIFDLSGTGTKMLSTQSINNQGTIQCRDSAVLQATNGASLVNKKTFSIVGDGLLYWNGEGAKPTFLNDRGSVLSKTDDGLGTPGIADIFWGFDNNGKVSVQDGVLTLSGGGISYGDYDIADTATLQISSNYLFTKQTSRFTGLGLAKIIGGKSTFDINSSATNLQLIGGQIAGGQDLSISKKFSWYDGGMQDAGTTTLLPGSITDISGFILPLSQRNLINSGTVAWSNGAIQADNGATITNNGLISCTKGTGVSNESGDKVLFINNATGILYGWTYIDGEVQNFGLLRPVLIYSNPAIMAPPTNPNLSFAVGSPDDRGGLINITGDLIMGTGAKIDIIVSGTIDPGTMEPLYGQLIIGGNVDLKSNCTMTVTLGGYTPAINDTFQVIRALSIASDFTTVTYPQFSPAAKWSSAKRPGQGSIDYTLIVGGNAPVISSFTPNTGVAGNVVTITGQALNNPEGSNKPYVDFGGAKAFATTATATQIVVPVPAAAKTAKLVVTTVGGSTATTAIFKVKPVITSFTPATAATNGVVTITGTNLITATTPKPTIKFNTGVAPLTNITYASATQVKVKVPATATTGKISLTTSDGTATSSQSFGFLPPPSITSFTPTSGKVGMVVTFTGKYFTNATTAKPTVKFNGVLATVKTASSTQVTVPVPPNATKGRITIQTTSGIATTTTDFTVLP